jgi:nicotinamide phosphoribosyltransferase
MYNRVAPDDMETSGGMILYGLQEIATDLLSTKIEHWMVNELEEDAEAQGLKCTEIAKLFRRVVVELDGNIPLKFEMLPEGTWVPVGTPFAQVSNTVEGYGELVTWWEGVLMKAYFASCCATEAYRMWRYLNRLREQFQFDSSFNIRFHSFGYRGHRSEEDAYWCGTAWALFLNGTDDFAIRRHVPTAKLGSISALAHKVTQQFDAMGHEEACVKWGYKIDLPGDVVAMFHAIDATYNAGEKIVALVIDTYDADRVIYTYLPMLAHYAKTKGIWIVMRPDSGEVIHQAIEMYRVCQQHDLDNVSVIIGEGMSFAKARQYDMILKAQGVPLTFVAYGIGGGFYEGFNRDWLGWGMKTAFSNGKPRMKFSMVKVKRSIPGEVGVVREQGELIVKPVNMFSDEENLYITIYYFDATMTTPEIVLPNWEETRQRAIAQDPSQKVIKLDPAIETLIEELRKENVGK